jgi:transcriptional regulator with XRE-family HTH domain
MAKTEVPDQLRALRAKLGINQAELARRLGVTASTVARWESGQSKPRLRIETITATVMAVQAGAFGASVGAAVGGVAGPVGIAAGAALGALGGLTISKFLRNAAKMGLSIEQAAELLDPSADPTDSSIKTGQESAQQRAESD